MFFPCVQSLCSYCSYYYQGAQTTAIKQCVKHTLSTGNLPIPSPPPLRRGVTSALYFVHQGGMSCSVLRIYNHVTLLKDRGIPTQDPVYWRSLNLLSSWFSHSPVGLPSKRWQCFISLLIFQVARKQSRAGKICLVENLNSRNLVFLDNAIQIFFFINTYNSY